MCSHVTVRKQLNMILLKRHNKHTGIQGERIYFRELIK